MKRFTGIVTLAIKKNFSTNANPSKKFAQERAQYNDQLKSFRKLSKEEYDAKKMRITNQREEETKRIVLDKALRIRERRKLSVLAKEQSSLRQQAYKRRYQENLARTLLNQEKLSQLQKERYAKLISDLKVEKDAWITEANMDSKIVNELFECHSSTGLHTPFSQYWKTQILTYHENRVLGPELETMFYSNEVEDIAKRSAEIRNQQTEVIESFLEGFVNTGEDRLKIRQVSRDISAAMEAHDDAGLDDSVTDFLHIQAEMRAGNKYFEGISEGDMAGDHRNEIRELSDLANRRDDSHDIEDQIFAKKLDIEIEDDEDDEFLSGEGTGGDMNIEDFDDDDEPAEAEHGKSKKADMKKPSTSTKKPTKVIKKTKK